MNYIEIKQHIHYRLYIGKREAKQLANGFIEEGWQYKKYKPTFTDLEVYLQEKLGKIYFKILKPVKHSSVNSFCKEEVIFSEYCDMPDEEFLSMGSTNED